MNFTAEENFEEFLSTSEITSEDKTEVFFGEIGEIFSIADGIATIHGLNTVTAGEMIEVESSKSLQIFMGMALNLNKDSMGAVVFASEKDISAGDRVFRTKNKVSVPTGSSVLGRVLNALGKPLDGKEFNRYCFKTG